MKLINNWKELVDMLYENEELVVSHNNENNVVVMSFEEYREKKKIIESLKQSEAEIVRGEGIEAEEVFQNLRQKYGY